MLQRVKSKKRLIINELESVGIRLNKKPPNIYFKIKKGGGIQFNSTLPLTHLDEKLVYSILHEYKIHNAEVLVKEDATADDFIDIVEGNRKYVKCLFLYNKIDTVTIEEIDVLAHQENSVVVSCNWNLNLDFLLITIWETLDLIRVYTKRKGEQPDFVDCLILRKSSTVETVCHAIHRSLVSTFKSAFVWGTSTKHQPQVVGLTHIMEDEDVIQINKKI